MPKQCELDDLAGGVVPAGAIACVCVCATGMRDLHVH